jgi:hypothetical protein
MIDEDFFLGSSFKMIGYADDQYTILWGAVDNLGHNETGNEIDIVIDNKPPIIMDGIGSPNVPYEQYTLINSSTLIFLNSVDEDVGNPVIYYSIDGGAIYKVYDSPFTVSYRTSQIIYWAEDILGNKANESIFNLVVDNTDSDLDGIDDLTDNDDDGDGLLDSEEDKNGNGIVDSDETDSKNPDTDYDGVWDDEDPYPLDKSRWGQEEETGNLILLVVMIVFGVLIILLLLFMILKKPPEFSREVKFEPHDKEEVTFEPHKEEVEFEPREEQFKEEIEFEHHDEGEVAFEPHEEDEVEFEPHEEDEVEFEPHDEPYEEEFEFESHEEESPDDEVEFKSHDEDEVEFEPDEDEEIEFEEE